MRPRRHTGEFKRDTVSPATAPGNSIAGVAADSDVDRSVVTDRVKKFPARCFTAASVRPLNSGTQMESEQCGYLRGVRMPAHARSQAEVEWLPGQAERAPTTSTVQRRA
jgi:hypothetical protein